MLDVGGLLVKVQFIVHGVSEVVQAFDHLNSFIMDAGGVVSCAVSAGSADDVKFCLV